MKLLEGKRIGLIGKPSDWLVASSPDTQLIEERLGVQIIQVSIEELITDIRKNPDQGSKVDIEALTEGANDIQEATQNDLNEAGATLQALRSIIKKYQLDAITVRCFDLVVELETTGCFALSQLLDEGLIAGCEGDLVSTIGMMAAQELTSQVPWMANPAQIDEVGNSFWLAHCTVPRTLVESYSIRSHFESGLGVGIQGFIEDGPVTVFRLGGEDIEKIWVSEGDIVARGNSEKLCRTQVEIKLSDGIISDLLNRPLGNHLVMVKGHMRSVIMRWFETEVSSSLERVT